MIAAVPNIITELPGPESRRLEELSKKYEPASIKKQFPIVWKKAKGVTVEDVDGNVFLDFTSSVLIANIGHNHPELIKAIKEQAEENIHSYNFLNPWRVRLAEKLVSITPESLDRAFFVTTGAEAVDLAVNAVKSATGRYEVLSFWGGYHGKSYATMSIGGKTSSREGFGPTMPGVLHAPFPYCYRCPMGKTYPGCGTACFDFAERMLEAHGTGNIACAVIEPFQGASGQIEPPAEFMQRLSAWCRSNDVALIMDEVQASFGRSGKLFSFEHFNIVPTIVVAGKGISSGIPLTAIIGESRILDNVKAGYLSSTHGGNPLSTMAACVTIDVLFKERLIENSARIGDYLVKRLREIGEEFDIVGEVRGKGLMIGMEIVSSKKGKEPASGLAARIVDRAIRKGLLLIKPIGFYGNVIRISPPLCLKEEEAEAGVNIIKEALREASNG